MNMKIILFIILFILIIVRKCVWFKCKIVKRLWKVTGHVLTGPDRHHASFTVHNTDTHPLLPPVFYLSSRNTGHTSFTETNRHAGHTSFTETNWLMGHVSTETLLRLLKLKRGYPTVAPQLSLTVLDTTPPLLWQESFLLKIFLWDQKNEYEKKEFQAFIPWYVHVDRLNNIELNTHQQTTQFFKWATVLQQNVFN